MGLNLNRAVAGMPAGDAFEQLAHTEKIAVASLLLRRLLADLTEQRRDADEYERAMLYQAIYWLSKGLVDPTLQYAQLACADANDRDPLAMVLEGVVPPDEGEPLADLLSYAERGERFDWSYPEDECTYGVLVSADTPREALMRQATALTRLDPDRVVLISIAPHDVRDRQDWNDIRIAFDVFPRDLEVRKVLAREVDTISDAIDVLKPFSAN